MRIDVVVAVAAAVLWGTDAAAQSSVRGSVDWNGRPGRDVVVVLTPTATTPPSDTPDTVQIDQRHLRFVPRVVVIPPGGTVTFTNSDPIMHNVFSPARNGADFNLGTYPRDEQRSHTFKEAGHFVILCHVHPEMVAWVAVVRSAYHAVTNAAGDFRVDAVPSGTYAVSLWRRGQELRLATTLAVGRRSGAAPLELRVTRQGVERIGQ